MNIGGIFTKLQVNLNGETITPVAHGGSLIVSDFDETLEMIRLIVNTSLVADNPGTRGFRLIVTDLNVSKPCTV